MDQPAGYHRSTTMIHASALAESLPDAEQQPHSAAGISAQQQQELQGHLLYQGDGGGDESVDVYVEPSNLDHALLESLFYNEMMMFDNNVASTPTAQSQGQHTQSLHGVPDGGSAPAGSSALASSAELFTQHLAEAAHVQHQQHHHLQHAQQQQQQQQQQNDHIQQDMNNLVEEEILRQFEMTTSALDQSNAVLTGNLPTEATSGIEAMSPFAGVIGHNNTTVNIDDPLRPIDVMTNSTSYPNYQATTTNPSYHLNQVHLQPQQQPPPPQPQIYAMAPSQYHHQHHHQQQQPLPSTATVPAPPPTPSTRRPAIPLQRAESFVALEVSETQGVPHHRARQLVDQFATLASRLGIDLPDEVLQSLTTSAVKNDPTLSAPVHTNSYQTSVEQTQQPVANTRKRPSSVAFPNNADTITASANVVSSPEVVVSENKPPVDPPPKPPSTILESQKAAQEAIATVTRQQQSSALTNEKTAAQIEKAMMSQETTAGNDSGSDTQDPSTSSSSHLKAPTYSKRRKKPRKQECESKLAQLRAENEQLKRHLENVTNKALKFDKGKEEAMKRIEQLMHEDAGPEKMTKAVHEFGHMYSDYGVNRQQELNFHLEQLQRLVNPTNFTKMGLWTLGQTSHDTKRNPIAGILVKELTITPQQGSKILEQSEKIRYLCQNLKETHALLGKLRALCEKKTKIFQDRMSKCTEILTSKQVVSLIVWINEHTELLGAVCPGWGTEQIRSK